MRLSANFTLGDMLKSVSHPEFQEEQAKAPPEVLANLRRHVLDLLQPCRDLTGMLRVNSGYRCPGLNRAVEGADNSAHMDGRAADVFPLEMSVVDAFNRIARSALPYDKLILESKGPKQLWIHVQSPKHWNTARRQLLMKWPGTDYEKYNPNDPRVKGAWKEQ